MIKWTESESTQGILHGAGRGNYPYIIMEVESESKIKYRVGYIVKEFFRNISLEPTIESAKSTAELHDRGTYGSNEKKH